MRTFYRGTTVDFATTFLSGSGAVLDVDSATITISYPEDNWPLDGGRVISTTYDMTPGTADGEWVYSWDSTLSGPGYVYWHMKANSTDAATEDGQFVIKSNPANTFLNAPTPPSSTDYV